MKVLKLDLKKNFAKVKVDNLDDLWVLSRVISAGDIIGSETSRIVKKTEEQEGKRRGVYAKIETEKVEFQKSVLRILGKITECSSPDVTLGSFHTITIEPKDVLSIEKEFQKWQIERLKDAEVSAKRPKVLLCAADYGDSTISVLREFGIEHITDVTKSLPGKRKEAQKIYEKSREDYLIELAKALEEISKAQGIEKIILGGVGFLIENFEKILEKFPGLKKRIFLTKISTSGKTGINELIKRGAVEKLIKGSRISEETKVIEEFFEEVAKDGPVTYGIKEVKKAVEYGAVKILLVSDDLIQEYREKEKYEELNKLMTDSEKLRARIMIISSEHESGERFAKMKIAALLRFKI